MNGRILIIDTSSKAKWLVIEQLECIITTQTKGKVFSICMPLSYHFQEKHIDLVTALKVAGDIQKSLQRFKVNVINDFSTKLQKIEQ